MLTPTRMSMLGYEALADTARRVRRQPRELLWRRMLLDSAQHSPTAARFRELIVESLEALLAADREAIDHQELADLLPRWSWSDAERVLGAVRVVKPAALRRCVEANFLLNITDVADEPERGLALARRALEQVPMTFRAEELDDFAELEGGVLIRLDPAEFLRRFEGLFGDLMTGPFAGRVLVDWLLKAKPAPDVATVVRAALEKVPLQNRDEDGEVALAAADGLAALARADETAVTEALVRMKAWVVGANFAGRKVLSLVKPLLEARRHVAAGVELLELTLKKRPDDEVRRALQAERRRR